MTIAAETPRISATADEVRERARYWTFSRVVLTVITAVGYAIGWGVAKAFTAIWAGLGWLATSVTLGWREARGTRHRPTRSELESEVRRLSVELERIA